MQSKQKESRLVVSGELFDMKGNPVVVILEMEPIGKRGIKLDDIKIASAYGKENMQRLIDTSKMMYINPDIKITSGWLKRTRLQLPFDFKSVGFNGIIAPLNSIVNTGGKYSIDVDLENEVKKYGISEKLNDYIAVQKAVVNHLKETGFFEKNGIVVNEDTGMEIRINPRGIKETLANGKRFQTLPRDLKLLKLATIEHLPEIIKQGELIEDDVENTYGENSLFAYFKTPIKINGKDYDVKVDIKKSIEVNKFWIHNVLIKEDSELLNPTIRQGIHETQNPLIAENIAPENKNVNGDKRYSILIDEDGIENYIISEETKALSYSERKKKLLNIMKDEYAGRTAKFEKNRKVYYAFYDERGIRKGIYGDKKSSKQGYRAKINIGAEGDYIELAENALYDSSKNETGRSNRFHENAQLWDYYVKTIKNDGRYYDVLINVKDTGEYQYVYDVTLKEAASLPNPRRLEHGSSTASTDSISQNTQKSNKKYSIDIDEALFSALDETYSREEEDIASILEEGFGLMKNVQVDERAMHKIAWHIKRDYQSKYDIDALTQNLTRVFAYLKSNQNVKYTDMVRLVQEIAKPVLEESTDIDKQQKEIYDNFRNYMKPSIRTL